MKRSSLSGKNFGSKFVRGCRGRIGLGSVIVAILWILLPDVATSQVELFGNNYLEFSVDRKQDQRYFEDWTEVYLSYQNWRIAARYEMHLPPQAFSQDSAGQGIYQRFLEYRTGNLEITAGNFYTMLGRGLVLRSFENRTLRWDTNIDGIHLSYHHPKIDFQVLGGKPRNRRGRRFEVLQAGEIRLKPVRQFHLGGTYLVTKLNSRGEVSWGSVFGQLSLGTQTLYGEYATKRFPAAVADGHALYVGGNFSLIDFNLSVEYKDYQQFDLTEGLTYNNPPTVFREHQYTLLNRHQRVQDANNEKGFMVEGSYPVWENGIATLNVNRTRNQAGANVYEEYYAQFELDAPEGWEWVWAQGRQKDLEAQYLNFVNTTLWNFSGLDALKLTYEHQQAKILLNNRQYYNQLVILSYSRASRVTLSLSGEHSTDQVSEKKYWAGMQVDWHFLEKFDLTIFGGTRREGKICAGGVCVVRPEFEGIEFILVNRF